MAKKKYDDDDGRSFADMSQLERPSMFGHLPGEKSEAKPTRPSRPMLQEDEMSKQERRWYMLGALKASLLIGLAYAVGLGLVILILLAIWKML